MLKAEECSVNIVFEIDDSITHKNYLLSNKCEAYFSFPKNWNLKNVNSVPLWNDAYAHLTRDSFVNSILSIYCLLNRFYFKINTLNIVVNVNTHIDTRKKRISAKKSKL